jgi:uncharacterized membrane-anchored protein
MNGRYIGLLIIAVVVLGSLGSFVLYNQWPLMDGKRIVLATVPVDPFDFIRGQYMTIGYEVSRMNVVAGLDVGDDVYVLLEKDEGGVWRKDGLSGVRPESGDFIKGNIIWVRGDEMGVEYGIEQYFFERGADLPTSNITVEVGLSNSGRAKIVQLLYNGEPVVIEYEKFDVRD